jgi:uncharacterized protein YozE (UPF0346 family)
MAPVDAEELSDLTPRAVHTFATPQEAIDFIVHCLESNVVIQLLAEIRGISEQVGRSKALVDRYKSAFEQMHDLHTVHDLRQVYADERFPSHATHYQLTGFLSQQADLALTFIKLDQGWALEQIDYL